MILIGSTEGQKVDDADPCSCCVVECELVAAKLLLLLLPLPLPPLLLLVAPLLAFSKQALTSNALRITRPSIDDVSICRESEDAMLRLSSSVVAAAATAAAVIGDQMAMLVIKLLCK